MTEEEALEISNKLAIAFMHCARELKAPRGAVLDSLVQMIARTLESYDGPELRASMIAKTEEVFADEIGAIKSRSKVVASLLDQALGRSGRGDNFRH
jgi:hypothetical protein